MQEGLKIFLLVCAICCTYQYAAIRIGYEIWRYRYNMPPRGFRKGDWQGIIALAAMWGSITWYSSL